jgi:hypothetical protein
MTPRAIAAVALKVWGMVLIVEAAISVPVTIWALATASVSVNSDEEMLMAMRQSEMFGVLSIIVQIVTGILLLNNADRLVKRLIPEGESLQINAKRAHLQAIAFALAGIFVLVEGIQDLAAAGYTLLTKPNFDETPQLEYLWVRQGEVIVRGAVAVTCGSILLFGRDAIATGWSRIRSVSPADWR